MEEEQDRYKEIIEKDRKRLLFENYKLCGYYMLLQRRKDFYSTVRKE